MRVPSLKERRRSQQKYGKKYRKKFQKQREQWLSGHNSRYTLPKTT